MNKKISAEIFTFLLILYFPLSINTLTVLYVNPSTIITSVSDTFSVNITISGVNDLGGWEFKLYYLSSNLNGTDLVQGPFLKQGGSTYFEIIDFTDNYNSTHGIAWVTCALLGAGPGVDGNGTLAVITFKAQQLGTSGLSLTDTLLSDSQPIPHVALNGIVHVLPHDVAITDLTLSKTVVGQGLTVKMDVNISDQGNFTETFNVTVYANLTSFATQTITLTSGNSTTITFTWNTTGFAKGNYTISAYAWPVPGETHTADNNYTYSQKIIVTLAGDFDGDGFVYVDDLNIFGWAWYTRLGDPNYNPLCDFDNDGLIYVDELDVFGRNWYKHAANG
jgi:hypothetical protein